MTGKNINTSGNLNAFKAIFEACEEGIIAVTRDGKITLANNAAHKIFGYSKAELCRLKVEDLIPSNLKSLHVKERHSFNRDPRPRRMGHGRDLQAVNKKGELFPVEISLNVAELDGEQHAIAYIIDITERKKIEAALKQSEEQLILYASELEKRVKERTEALDQSVSKLEKANEELETEVKERLKAESEVKKALSKERELSELKSRFVSMASHEFRTPLSTMLSSTGLIEKYLEKPEHEERITRHINKIRSSINNLNDILNDFLSISKLEEGKIDASLGNINLLPIVEEVIEELEALKKEGQNIIKQIKGTPCDLKADEKILKNIIINLLSNAIKYSEKTITLTCDFSDKKNVLITIKDEGQGIPIEDQKHLFERFFRAKNATNIQGTGLGLNIVKKYVEMLNGSITFKSELNVGSEFNVKLPKTI